MKIYEVTNEPPYNQDDINKIFNDLLFIAGKERMFSLFWAEYYHSSQAEREEIVNAKIVPVLERYGYPKPWGADSKYLDYQTEIMKWNRDV